MIVQSNGADFYDFAALMINGENIKVEKKEITIDYILNAVCSFYQIQPEKIKLKTNKTDVVRPRQISHYYARLLTKKSLAEIGREVGDKDHATVINSCKSIQNLIETDKNFREKTIKPINSALGIY